MLHSNVGSFFEQVAVLTFFQIFITTPKDITEFIIRQSNPSKIGKAQFVEHFKEELFYPLPPTVFTCFLEINVFGKSGKVFFGSLAEIPTIL